MTTVAEIQRQARKVRRPRCITQVQWLFTRRLLVALATFGHDCYPGMPLLAKRLRVSTSTIGRHVLLLEKAGLISRSPRPGSRWSGMTYTLLFAFPKDGNEQELPLRGSASHFPSEEVSSSGGEAAEETPEETPRQGSPEGKPDCPVAPGPSGPRRCNRWTGYCCVCQFPVQALAGWLHGKMPVHRQCDMGVPMRDDPNDTSTWGNSLGADPDRPKPTMAKVAADPGRRLAHYFANGWEDVVAYRKDLRSIRPIDNGPAVGYLRTTMLPKFTESHIMAMIDGFMEYVAEGEVEIREGQSAWQRFTAWWGRVPIEDPAITDEIERECHTIREAARTQMAIKDAERQAWIDSAPPAPVKPDDTLEQRFLEWARGDRDDRPVGSRFDA